MPPATPRPARSIASPNTGAGFTSQHPTFYPPSYYAAANGFSYTQKRRTSTIQPSILGGYGYHDTAGHYDHFMPVSYIPDTSSSESSFEINRPPSSHSNHTHASKSTKVEKRQSQITGLPQLEANLLPSLRDTVVRMTRTPPRVAPLQSAFNQNDHRHESQQPSLLRSNNHPSDFSSNAHDPRLVQKRGFVSPREPPPSDDSCSFDSSPPRTKDSLKLTPRTQTPRTLQGQETPRVDSSATASPRRPSLRPIKSILTRRSPADITPTKTFVGSPKNPVLKASLQTPKQNSSSSRSPSRADHHRSKDRLYQTSAVNNNVSEREKRDRPQPEKRLNSNIPRLRARPLIDHPQISFSDSSDLERRYEEGRKEQRKLTVTNTDVLSNSSSSDHNHSAKFSLRSRQSPSKVGLGLNYHFPEAKSPRVKFESHTPNARPGYTTLNAPRCSIVSFASSVSCYSTATDDGLPSVMQPQSDYERQRAALLELVSTLDQKTQRRATQSSESSDYHGVEGVAYSGSSEMVAQDEVRQTSATHNSRIKESRRRSQYMPGSMPFSVVEGLHRQSPPHEAQSETYEVESTTVRLARRSLMIAAQEREAFGLRPSDSEKYRQEYEKLRCHSRYESRLSESSVEDLDELQDTALSHEASHMLHSIQTTSNSLDNSGLVSGKNGLGQESPTPEVYPAPKTKSPILSPIVPTRTAEERIARPVPDVMDKLVETERRFVKQMQTCIQYYVLPLRVHGSRAWISGVPPDISRFLDWLEDILHLHEQVLVVLRGPKSDVIRQILLFLPRFEIYQPYLVRLEQFSKRLQGLPDGESDFRSFVDLQDQQIQKTGWSLSRYIFEPEKRLQEYLTLFSGLLQITPRDDPQHIHVFSLIRSMELIVDVMTTVKQEEQDHQATVTFLGRFETSGSLGYLADRKRILLWKGLLVLRYLTSEDRQSRRKKPELGTRTRMLSRAINAWDDKGPDNSQFDERRDSSSSYGSEIGYSIAEDGSQEGSPSLDNYSTRSTQVFASVFSDLVVFGEPVPDTSNSHANSNSMSYRLLDSIGLARVFSVQGCHIETGERPLKPDKRSLTYTDTTAILVELIPVTSADSSLRNMVPRIERIQLSQLESVPGSATVRNVYQDCFSAFRRSSDHTTQLWCRPWKTSSATPQNLASFGDSGLPLLKSPPGTRTHGSKARQRDTSISMEEREERSWWSFRFHQVMTNKREVPRSM